MSPENPDSEVPPPEPPPPSEPAPEPPAPEPSEAEQKPMEPEVSEVPEERPEELDDWTKRYEEETEQVRPKKKRHYGGLIATVVIILVLVVWTLLSPAIMPESGTTYTNSNTYASLGSYSNYRDIWWLGSAIHVGNTTWGISIGGDSNATEGVPATFEVFVSKVSEDTGNFWFRGTAIKLKEAAIYTEDGTFLGSMDTREELEFGSLATISVTFDDPGQYDLVMFVRFMVYEVMRIGFIPLETVEISSDFAEQIEVSAAQPP